MDSNLQKYIAFLKTAQYKSFTRAAQHLHYSQSGISRMIHDLEQEWHVQLFERKHSTVDLTSDGISILPQVQALCAEYEKLHMHIDALNGLQTGMIRIGAFSSVATHWLPSMIHAFHEDYPNIQYEVLIGDYAEIETWIQEGRVDCGFVHLPTRTNLETTLLEQDLLVAVLPPNHPLAAQETIAVSDLAHDPFLLLERGDKSEIMSLFEKEHISPNICFTTWEDYAAMAMVEQGLCITATPQLILTRMPYRIAVRPIEPLTYRSICFAVKSKASISLAVQYFINYLDCRPAYPKDSPYDHRVLTDR